MVGDGELGKAKNKLSAYSVVGQNIRPPCKKASKTSEYWSGDMEANTTSGVSSPPKSRLGGQTWVKQNEWVARRGGGGIRTCGEPEAENPKKGGGAS